MNWGLSRTRKRSPLDSPAIRLRPHVRFEVLSAGGVLLDERRGLYWQVNPTAATGLTQLLSGCSLEQAAVSIAASFEVNPEVVRDDLAALVSSLQSQRLLRE